MRKLKLSIDRLTVEAFAAEEARDDAKGTVDAREMATYERSCYTPVHDCYTLPWICFTTPEGGCD